MGRPTPAPGSGKHKMWAYDKISTRILYSEFYCFQDLWR